MTDQQWNQLLEIIKGKSIKPLPVGFIIDSPWLPNWHGIRIIDYFTNDELWLQANLHAIKAFPEVMFLPGFWSEYGMCTEPSAFGARCTFPANEFPHAHKILRSADDIELLPMPNPQTDGLLPLVLNRLRLAQPHLEAAGHRIRFAVARGPLNIASYLIGMTELMTIMMMQPERTDALITKITTFLKDWLLLQMETFPTIDGIFLLDDIIGFIGEPEFQRFALPYFKELFSLPVTVKFLHNDAPCVVSAPFLPGMGVNLFNMGFDVSLAELKTWTENSVTLLGNLPPRDVLASADALTVKQKTIQMIEALPEKTKIIFSCGGGMPPGVSSENIKAFIEAVQSFQ